ncbi:nitric oxide reductase activation protein NorD [Mycolicibacterium sp. CBMA 226]|uniref:nitric oxide reductase activation protein NorD n=1 Tax=Mycolicibacterium sp. CBMA 226 TaxID=2606611 RepID=UPI0012DFD4BA|nr:VWA domain-containing protein [Mycolicibacterium sp. CBMA 226]MUL79113.1 VWA domain-containing protein [Mycolicibacterium sp. CBMA 226]
MTDSVNSGDAEDGVRRFGLLASAMAGRPVGVAAAARGEPAWTDGDTMYVDPSATAVEQRCALAVQSSLLAAGSLEPDILRRIGRRSAVAARYLAVEGHRALAQMDGLLPPAVRVLIDAAVAARSDSPEASLALALSREPIAEPPEVFGTIKARNMLAASKNAVDGHQVLRGGRQPELVELPGDAGDVDDDAENAGDIFTSPVGGGGGLGKLLSKMLSVARKLGGGGTPGADTPTHWSRSGPVGGGHAVVSMATAAEEGSVGEAGGFSYPEWDSHRRGYRANWCTVQELEPEPDRSGVPPIPDHHGLRRPLARLGVGLDRCRRQPQGDDVDIDAAVEAQAEFRAGSVPDEAVYIDSLRRRRDLSVLLLLDTSGSVGQPSTSGLTVHEHQRAAAAALMVALHDLGDRVALYAFQSQGRSAVRVMPVKRFGDDVSAVVLRRLHGLRPGAYSRLGAAIRHGSAVLKRDGGTARRLLVVLSDGLAYDHGYERAYGAADARRALAESRRQGIGCLCLTVGAATYADELRMVFGSAAHATLPRLDQLSATIGPLFRSALQSADGRRRISTPTNTRGSAV